MRRFNHNLDPRIITAKFNSVCSESGKQIKKGEECLYYPSSKSVFCLDTKQAESFRSWQFDVKVLGYDY